MAFEVKFLLRQRELRASREGNSMKKLTTAILALALVGMTGSVMGQANVEAKGAKGGYRGCLVEVKEILTLHFWSGAWSSETVYVYDDSSKGLCGEPVATTDVAIDWLS